MKRYLSVLLAGVLGVAIVVYYQATRREDDLVLTGIVTTDGVIVGSEVQGQLQQLFVREGDAVEKGQLLGRIQPEEWKADMAFYADSERQSAAQVDQAEADLRFQEAQTRDQIRHAEATLAATAAQLTQGKADLENARLVFERERTLYGNGVESKQAYDQARTAHDAARAHVVALGEQVEAAQASLAMARSNADQVAARRAALDANRHRLAAAGAQKEKAKVQLGYTEIRAPIAGIVDVRATLQGEIVRPGQAIVTLIDPDNLWVRADIEETYIDRVHLGDEMTVHLPSGAEWKGIVSYRGADADYATQRDVSRTKRDIKTFEIRLRGDNSARNLAVGMTAYVTLPLEPNYRQSAERPSDPDA